MKYFPRRRPSPALLISCIALFVSLSGVSYGVATGFIDGREIKNNSISHRDVRNNTLRTFDIRNNEVRGFDVRNSSIQGKDIAFNTLTGNDVSEASLGEVPRAAAATSATSASTVAVLKTIPPTPLAEGAAPVTLATQGPLTLSATCVDVAGDTVARLRVQTTEANSAAGGGVNEPVLDPGEGPVTVAELTDLAAGARSVGEGSAFGSAPSGRAFTARFGLLADSSAGSCRFHGHVVLEG